jgi:hypothetical protein
MMRLVNFVLIALTGLVCLALYRTAEEARVAAADLRATTAAIAHERSSLIVLGAEWAKVTQPQRIQALVQKHLPLSDKPTIHVSSVMALPPKNPPLLPEGAIRSAKVVVPVPSAQALPAPAMAPAQSLPGSGAVIVHTGT